MIITSFKNLSNKNFYVKKLKQITKNLFNVYALFTREPFVQYFSKEVAYFSDDNGILGLITYDITDADFAAILLSRDSAKQYRAEGIEINFATVEKAKDWLEKELNSDRVVHHAPAKFFDLFALNSRKGDIHPIFEILENSVAFSAAKSVIKEISYHYKDIDGNFIQQFQSLNGFEARLWEIYLFCFFRELYFSFNRNSYSPDFMIEKLGIEIAVEAVILSRVDNSREAILNQGENSLTTANIEERLKNDVPIRFASSLTAKLNKRYWELPHVKGKALMIAVADFHAHLSMTWSFQALLEYLYGYKITHKKGKKGKLVIKYEPIENFTKPSGAKITAGFFKLPDSENISAVLCNPIATISKFNRMGKQAGLGSNLSRLIRTGFYHDFTENADKPLPYIYEVGEETFETWSEGASIFHNPKANIKIDPDLFPNVAHHFFIDGKIVSRFPTFFPYNSKTQNLVLTSEKKKSNI
jgi:hypothetical protein